MVGVWLSDDEHADLAQRAETLGIAIPRLLVESATLGETVTLAERRAVYGELAALRRMTEALTADVRRALGTRSGEVTDAEAGLRELIARQGQVLDALTRVTR